MPLPYSPSTTPRADTLPPAAPPVAAAAPEDSQLQRFRERVAATIALTVIAGAVAMMVVAMLKLETDNFERIKDLLLFVNPLLGVVIGYYFNKVSTEARAESAETAATGALATAQREVEARQAATLQAEANRERMQQARATLAEVAEAAEAVLTQEESRPTPGTLGGEASRAPAGLESRLELQAALRRARRVME